MKENVENINFDYPVILEEKIPQSSDYWKKLYFDVANSLLSTGYNDSEEFDEDDIVDAFMKGCSVAHQFVGAEYSRFVYNEKQLNEQIDRTNKVKEILENINDNA